jgi:hypothetical protein
MLWSVFPFFTFFTIKNIMDAEQISNKRFFVRAEEEAIAACSFGKNITWYWIFLGASSRKLREAYSRKQLYQNHLYMWKQNLFQICVVTVLFVTDCEIDHKCYNGWHYLNCHEIVAVITWTVLTEMIFKQLLIFSSANKQNAGVDIFQQVFKYSLLHIA